MPPTCVNIGYVTQSAWFKVWINLAQFPSRIGLAKQSDLSEVCTEKWIKLTNAWHDRKLKTVQPENPLRYIMRHFISLVVCDPNFIDLTFIVAKLKLYGLYFSSSPNKYLVGISDKQFVI